MIKNLILLYILLSLVSCANNPFSSYKTESDKMLNNIYSGAPSAICKTDSHKDILYYMENGIYQRMLNNYSDSDKDLAISQKAVDEWVNSWRNTTSGNIITDAEQFLVNDNVVDYQPKGYEKTSISAFRALDHIDLNHWQAARVEIQKMYEIEAAIKNYNEALYEKEKSEQQELLYKSEGSIVYTKLMNQYRYANIESPKLLLLKNSYQSAFSHYLAGFVFEALGEFSLSRPGYLNALKLNPENILSKTSIANLDQGNVQRPGFTNLLVIEEVGHAPQYQSREFSVPFNYNASSNNQGCINQINVFFPKLIPDKQGRKTYNYTIDSNKQNPELYTDYDLMAARYLHDQIPHLIFRNIASATRNLALSQAICSATVNDGGVGSLLSLGVMAATTFIDRVDERSWVLLPSKVYLSRIQLPYGKHTLQIRVRGNNYLKTLNLNSPYQIFDMRVMGDKVFFIDQQL